jgi:S-methylmethionine-dependent homocysteine/selenocysteine methylase
MCLGLLPNQGSLMNRYNKILKRLINGDNILIDGATGTEIEKRGVPMVKNAWNGGGALTHPEIVRQVHEDYITCGAQIVISNTFSTSRHILEDAGLGEHFEFLNRRGVELAIEARTNQKRSEVLVAGGITHWSFTGEFPSPPILKSNTEDQAAIMANAGADLIILEMMSDLNHTMVMLDAARKSGLPVWIGFSCRLDQKGEVRLLDGPLLREGVEAIKGEDIPILFIMHTEVEYIEDCLSVLKDIWQKPVGVYAHSGKFVEPNWIFNDVITPEDYSAAAKTWLKHGVQVIGGCCGIGLEHIRVLKNIFTNA